MSQPSLLLELQVPASTCPRAPLPAWCACFGRRGTGNSEAGSGWEVAAAELAGGRGSPGAELSRRWAAAAGMARAGPAWLLLLLATWVRRLWGQGSGPGLPRAPRVPLRALFSRLSPGRAESCLRAPGLGCASRAGGHLVAARETSGAAPVPSSPRALLSGAGGHRQPLWGRWTIPGQSGCAIGTTLRGAHIGGRHRLEPDAPPPGRSALPQSRELAPV